MIDYRPITNGDGHWIGVGGVVPGEEDRGVQILSMFTYEKILKMNSILEIRRKLLPDETREEALDWMVQYYY